MFLKSKDKKLSLHEPQIMGIVNLSPESFSDGYLDKSNAATIDRVARLVEYGAKIIDLGAESTRPFSTPISIEEELNRLLPIIELLKDRFPVWISVDSYKYQVQKEVIKLGIDLINDIYGLSDSNLIDLAVEHDLAVCIMHMQGTPQDMQIKPIYTNLIKEMKDFFNERLQACFNKGLQKSNICLDPGFGFGKDLEQNYLLLKKLQEFKELGCPLLIGTSRKSMIGNIINKDADQRLAGSLVTNLIAVQNGAKIIRVHDVQEHYDMLKIFNYYQKIK